MPSRSTLLMECTKNFPFAHTSNELFLFTQKYASHEICHLGKVVIGLSPAHIRMMTTTSSWLRSKKKAGSPLPLLSMR